MISPATAPDEESIRALLRRVVDPEVGANIVDLGLVYRIDIASGRVDIAMTMTSPACPMGEMILDDVRAALADGLPSGWQAAVELVWEPPWSPDRMSERTRRNFGW
ncbi:MAG: metal-sulfur cluster assembly factor [Betaproteobacteria bacterium]|nr:metal-sulfur cluster assembly factor [Betaproteobacteria bacterium]